MAGIFLSPGTQCKCSIHAHSNKGIDLADFVVRANSYEHE